MTLNVSNIGQNPQQPGINAEAFIPDQLIAGNAKLITDTITVSAGTLARGTVLGKKTLGAASAAAKSGGNTGTGTITLDPTTPIRARAKAGVYTVRCIAAATNGGVFEVKDPDGYVIGHVTITGGAGGTAVHDDQIKFTLTDATTDFVVGDGFDVTIAAGDGTYIASVATAVDGSQVPAGILVDTADASSGSITTGMYKAGEFNQNAIVYDSSWGGSLAAAVAALQPYFDPLGIYLKSFESADDPS